MRLFGMQLEMAASPMKKCFSTDCLTCPAAASSSPSPSSSSSLVSIDETAEKTSNGYLSDGLVVRTQERKKGKAIPVLLGSASVAKFALISRVQELLGRRKSTNYS